MKYNKKGQLLDKIGGLEFVNPDGYGAQHVPKDLVLVGEDWWIERYEYDGAEWWDFKSIPARKQYIKNIKNLHKGMWDTLKEMNEE